MTDNTGFALACTLRVQISIADKDLIYQTWKKLKYDGIKIRPFRGKSPLGWPFSVEKI
jgi:hypothetical protein